MCAGNEVGERCSRVVAGGEGPVDGTPHEGHVAPVVVGLIERVHRHQFDHVHAEIDEMVEPFDHPFERPGEAADMHLVHHRVGVQSGDSLSRRPRTTELAEGYAIDQLHVGGGGVEQRAHPVGDEPVAVAVVGLHGGRPVAAVALHRHGTACYARDRLDDEVELCHLRRVHTDGTDDSHGAPAWQPP